jgi:hypothetical protein
MFLTYLVIVNTLIIQNIIKINLQVSIIFWYEIFKIMRFLRKIEIKV